jgi:hypothetical protein
MNYWMKRRIQRSRARCHKAQLSHRQAEMRAEAKQEHESKTASRARTRRTSQK